MNYIDVFLLILLGGFMLYGFWFGLIQVIGSLVGLVIGAFAAARFYAALALWLGFLPDNLAKVIAFLAILLVISKLVGLLFWLVDRSARIFAIIPFLMMFNRLLGAALACLEGLLLLGFGVWFVARHPWSAALGDTLAASVVARVLNFVGQLLAMLAPAAVWAVKSVF
jgi:uncharacterized membrane protein required for colicin V production